MAGSSSIPSTGEKDSMSDAGSFGSGLNVNTSASTSAHSFSGEFVQTSQTVASLFQKQNTIPYSRTSMPSRTIDRSLARLVLLICTH